MLARWGICPTWLGNAWRWSQSGFKGRRGQAISTMPSEGGVTTRSGLTPRHADVQRSALIAADAFYVAVASPFLGNVFGHRNFVA